MKTIVSLDGGGVRILPAAVWLQKQGIVKADLWAGTSAGGLVALCMAAGKGIEAPIRLFRDNAAKIFRKRPGNRLWPLTRAKYDPSGLRTVLEELFGDEVLVTLPTEVLVVTCDYQRRRNPEALFRFTRYKPFSCVDAGMATSAAPGYFPPHEVGHRAFMDGGLMANNPADLALAYAMRKWGADEDYHLISIGTGLDEPVLDKRKIPRLTPFFLDDIIAMGIDGRVGATEQVIEDISTGMPRLKYTRVNFLLDRKVDLDSADEVTIQYLLSLPQRGGSTVRMDI